MGYCKTALQYTWGIVFGVMLAAGALCAAAAFAAGGVIEKLDPNMAAPGADGKLLWYDALALDLEGKGWTDTKKPYDRLPGKAEGVVRKEVWSLSRHSAGMAVRFMSDADTIAARWTVTNERLAMPHMPATGVSGLDLYVNDKGVWRWIGVGRPEESQSNEKNLAEGIPPGMHEYLLYTPLYNGLESLAIGVPPSASIGKAPARPADLAKPMVMYGTSILHGGCASRPGMAYPAILGRRLERPVINLGFSGNGELDPEMGVLMAELDASVYVIDCAPNLSPDLIAERTQPFVEALHKARPGVPIVLVENIFYQKGAFLPEPRRSYEDKNRELRQAYEALVAKGVDRLYYVEGAGLLGSDGEATVDGTHPTDLGFMRMADAIEPALRRCLAASNLE